MSRSTSQASSATTTTSAQAPARSLSVKTNNKPPPISNPLPPSDTRVFVTNLRLLDLDLLPDWPNISVQTFSSKAADQKQRIGGVEWALFRLFEIWDHDETSQKLQPFFPPLEPLQSLNLRAALYRCLNELKKNGILSRDAVLRKTMLDECKGEKFFELLASFSTTVLKKVLAAQPAESTTASVARQYSTAAALSLDSQASLLPLAIAHKGALRNILKRKDEKRKRYAEFESVLNAKAKDFNARIKHSKATPRSSRPLVPENEAAAIKKHLYDNWVGDRKWIDAMLHGDNAQAEDAFLKRRFESVWRIVEAGRKPEEALPEAGLLENLQSRVQEQQSRLQKWQQFHDRLRNDTAELSSTASKSRTTATEFRFEDHLQFQVRNRRDNHKVPVNAPKLRPEYADIISELHDGLEQISQTKTTRQSTTRSQTQQSSTSTISHPPTRQKQPDVVQTSRILGHRTENTTTYPQHQTRKQSRDLFPIRPHPREVTDSPIDSDATLVGQPSTIMSSVPVLPRPTRAISPHLQPSPTAEDETQQGMSDALPTATSPSPVNQEADSPPVETSVPPSPSPTPYFPSEPPVLELPPQTEEEAMAEQIISSIGNATPSPVKKPQPRLSLVERTRMSMAHTSSFAPIDEDSDMLSPSLPELPPPPTIAEDQEPTLNRRTSLLDRTRLSMAAMSAHRPSAEEERKKKKRESSARQSLFPVNQFDTPRNRRSFHAIEEAKSSASAHTPKEDLFSDEVDYDRVFRSRPRVAHSPIFSPEERAAERTAQADGDGDFENGDVSVLGIGGEDDEEFDEGVTGVDLADVDRDSDEDGFTQAWDNSPLRKAGVGAMRRQGKLFG
ncbi:hypothetical protein BU24DRAFT_439572 [Aaosphaeria arxii CBS 175.79]|uniref:HAUS augmin-like complex subunit 6 N-terminal domain-containing protein n=1 Tax=Aaosphaeria arxii CBS 175.79 TaxID=1450172 RepID=A0A6A5Y2H6_9PLEO|nr:uncharacterized protein BU24DRAFT_439572 [Aaosphaeria arxii CBS 175.79]KAF2019436.1 hypothetical protein BU24DRAFT_439572 [Aaosphaeria arxii CBS 175.79]